MKKKDLSIIIAHYLPSDNARLNPLIKTLESINSQKNNYNIEIIIADDGSDYTNDIINNFSKKISIEDDKRDIYVLNNNKLNLWLKNKNINTSLISNWVYIPKYINCMSKARVVNQAVKLSSSNYLCFLDDDNSFHYLNREKVKYVQTPQGFNYNLIYSAYKNIQENINVFSDNMSTLISHNPKVNYKFINGESSNFKITTIEDIDKAKTLLK